MPTVADDNQKRSMRIPSTIWSLPFSVPKVTKSLLHQLLSKRNQLLPLSEYARSATTGCLLLRPSTIASNNMLNHLPFFASGPIVKGFGRGSKELNIPTANYPLEVVKSLPPVLKKGIYYGWANVDNGEVYKMVMSIGTNPYYDNKEKSMETHIMHNFNCDLYGRLLKTCIVGYLRPETSFNSLEELIAAIHEDINKANCLLDCDAECQKLKDADFFKE